MSSLGCGQDQGEQELVREPEELLIAQALIEGVPIMTAEAVFGRYDVQVIRAEA